MPHFVLYFIAMHSRTWVIGVAVASVFAVASGSVLAQYDSYTGTYNPPYVDYSSPTWTRSTDSVIRSTPSGTSGTSSSGSGTSTSTTSTIPAGAIEITVWGTYGNLVNLKSGGIENRVSGDWASMKVYVRNTATNRPDLSKPVGVLRTKREGASYITGDGYYLPDQLAVALGESLPSTTTSSTTTTTTSPSGSSSTSGGSGGWSLSTSWPLRPPAGALSVTARAQSGGYYWAYYSDGRREERVIGQRRSLVSGSPTEKLGGWYGRRSYGTINTSQPVGEFDWTTGDGYLVPDKLATVEYRPESTSSTTTPSTTSTTTTTPGATTPSAVAETTPSTTTTPTTTTTTPATPTVVEEPTYASSAPVDTTPVTIGIDGYIYDATTNQRIVEAQYDSSTKKIYYGDTDATFGGLLSATTGWVNIKPATTATTTTYATPSTTTTTPSASDVPDGLSPEARALLGSLSTTPTVTSPPSTVPAITEIRIPTDAVAIGVTPDAVKENAALPLVQKALKLPSEDAIEGSLHGAVITYVAYGHTAETAKIGAGERASTVERFRVLYGDTPKTEQDYRALQAMVIESGLDIVAVKRSIEAERKGLGAFKRIFKHLPATTTTEQELKDAEWKALRIITYGLKPLRRDLVSEQRVIKSFTARFGKPKTVEDWDAIRACVYGSPHTCPLLAR